MKKEYLCSTHRSKLADRPMQIRVFTEAWPGEQDGEVLAGGGSRKTSAEASILGVGQSIVSFV
jgi:hypothetical protein